MSKLLFVVLMLYIIGSTTANSVALQRSNIALTQGDDTSKTNTRIADESGCSRGQFAPHPTDCNKYLQCQWGLYETYSCPSGLHWNNNSQVCDWPSSKDGSCAMSAGGSEQTEGPKLPSSTEPTSMTVTKEWSGTSTTQKLTPKPSKKPTIPHPTLSGYYKVVCYFTNWASYRQGIGKYLPEDIDGNLCTHILYAFAVLDSENLVIKAHDSVADLDNRFYERVLVMREKGLKVLLTLGGNGDSHGDKYSRLVNNPAARQRFIQHALAYLLKYNFDGLDLDWEFPKCWQANCDMGPDSDKQNFGIFVREIKEAFRPHGLLLSAAVSPNKAIIDAGYDVKALAENLDWISVMTYDYHGQWDKKTGHVAPMYYHPDDDNNYFNANFSVNYWISEGVPPRKLVMGMPLYGRSFRLADPSNHGLNAPAPGPGEAGEHTKEAGFLAYYEICDRIQNGGWTVVKDPEHRMGPYAYKGEQWVSFDDQDMIQLKSEYVRDMGLGGGMIWALDLDDFRNTCGGGAYPLLKMIANTLSKPPDGVVLSTQPTTMP